MDPFLQYPEPLKPVISSHPDLDIIRKLSLREPGDISIAPSGSTTKIIRNIKGYSSFSRIDGLTEIESWLALPGMSHFLFVTDEGGNSQAPSGIGLLSAGVAFCFITQIARYIENMNLNVDTIRLVQFTPFSLISGKNNDVHIGDAEPIETHLFLNGSLSEDMFEKLLSMSARTCYLHATANNILQPKVKVIHNSREIALTSH